VAKRRKPEKAAEPNRPTEDTRASPEELAVREQVAEEGSSLPRWTCPGCDKVWEGEAGSLQWKSWKSHLYRHAHAHKAKALHFGSAALRG
jgi:hypothetical protein